MRLLSKQSDENLIISFLSGNNRAFEALLYRHKDSLYRYIFYIVKDRNLADDFFQDTFIKAIVVIKQGQYSENGYFYSWLCRLARNMIIDYYRKNKQVQNNYMSDESMIDFLSNKIVEESDICSSMIEEDTICELNHLLSLLPPDQQEIIELRFYQNLSFKEIAERLDISINTALGRIRYAILNIRKYAEKKAMIF